MSTKIQNLRKALDNALLAQRVLPDAVRNDLGSYSVCNGPPYLHCSPSWGQALLHNVDPTAAALRWLPDDAWDAGNLQIWAQGPWLNTDGPYILVVRRAGVEVIRVESRLPPAPWEAPLRVEVDASTIGDGLLAELRCSSGRIVRSMHILPPKQTANLSFAGLMLSRARSPSKPQWISSSASLFPDGSVPERGFGIELELLTQMILPLDSCVDDDHAHEARLRKTWAQALAECADDDLQQHFDRWVAGADPSLGAAAAATVSRILEAYSHETGGCLSDIEESSLKQMLAYGQDTHMSEFRSPKPPHELSFAKQAESRLHSFVRILSHMPAVVAVPIVEQGTSGTSVHVHVNVCNTNAAGTLLSPREILAVWVAWVRFDLVTTGFSRQWMWQEPAMSPLYATGPEMSTTYRRNGPGEPAAWGEDEVLYAHGREEDHGPDVPAFIAEVQLTLRSDGFDALPVEEQRKRIFSDAASKWLHRRCSLNLVSVCKYGTLEVRRYHGTIDAVELSSWAAFCVAFVECFRSHSSLASAVFDAPLVNGLAKLQEEQERATFQELKALMTPYLAPTTFDNLLHHRQDTGVGFN